MTPNDWDNGGQIAGMVIPCRKCGHISDHGKQSDPRIKSTFNDGVTPRRICQVPVYTALPDGLSKIGTPCGCDGTGPDKDPPAPVVLKPPPQCFRPGCPEFATGQSSFCSERCKDEMAAAIANFGGDYGNTERSSGPGVEVAGQGDHERVAARGESRPRGPDEQQVDGALDGWLSDGDAAHDGRGRSDEQVLEARKPQGTEAGHVRDGQEEPDPAEVELDWLDA